MTLLCLNKRIAQSLIVTALLCWPPASMAHSGPLDDLDLRTDPRDFYVPDFRTVQIVDLEREEILGADHTVVGSRFVPVSRGAKLTGRAKIRAIFQLDRSERLCLSAAHGPDRTFEGFQDLAPVRLTILASTALAKSERILLTGTTSYVGPEDQNPGEFSCLIGTTSVISWTFRPFHP